MELTMVCSFTIDSNYVITAIEVDGVTYNCSLQINADWVPFLLSCEWNSDMTEINGVCIGDETNENNFVFDGTCESVVTDFAPLDNIEPWTPPTYEINILYDGTKYTNMKCWSDYIWFTDKDVGNPLWSEGGYLKYTVGYAPVALQFTKVENGVVVDSSVVYTADHSGTWLVHDDGTWERVEPVSSKE